jgi:hypothetical protein
VVRKRITIELPEELTHRLQAMSILNLVEPGAGAQSVLTHTDDTSSTVRHPRLGVTVKTESV